MTILKKVFKEMLFGGRKKEAEYEKWKVQIKDSSIIFRNPEHFKELCEDAAIAKETGEFIRIIILPIFLCILAGVISYLQDNSENFETFFTKAGIACIIFEVILLLFLFKELDREYELELLKEMYINGIEEDKHCPNTENISVIIEEHTELKVKKSKKKHKKNKRK